MDPGVRKRFLDAADQLSRLAFRHTVAILLAPPGAPSGTMHNGSGFVLRLGPNLFLGTAFHVFEHWIKCRSRGEPVLFEIGALGLDPSARLAWSDEASDLAFIRLNADEIPKIDVSVCEPVLGWPPPQPQKGQNLFVCGFPGQIRERPGEREVDFKSFAAHLIVEEVRDQYIVCQFERNVLADINGVEIPIADLDLGGISGGPAFLVDRLSYPLVAVISQFTEFDGGFGLLRLATMSHVTALAV